VLRIAEGASIEIFDGRGASASAEVLEVRGGSVTLKVVAPLQSRESPLNLAMGVAVPKGDRMTWVVQKLTELGVRRIVPLVTERVEMRKEACERNLGRWRRVALESCKQSGRSRVPDIDVPAEPEELLLAHRGARWMAHPGAARLAAPIDPETPALALVGPEGGWSERELALADSCRASLFGLGPRVLRTETAAIAAAVLLQSMAGDL
jgi:16S rRNA (uracil1498-N3)-methyltransferase